MSTDLHPPDADTATSAADVREPSAGRDGTAKALVGLVTTLSLVGAVLAGLLTATGSDAADGGTGDVAAEAMPGMIAADGVLDIATVAPAVAAEYQHAADHADHFAQLRCWCGCEAAFDHPSLLECFVRPDGGWEAHGAGCGVCMAEAMTARARLADGITIADISAEIDATYGPASLPTRSTTDQEPTT